MLLKLDVRLAYSVCKLLSIMRVRNTLYFCICKMLVGCGTESGDAGVLRNYVVLECFLPFADSKILITGILLHVGEDIER